MRLTHLFAGLESPRHVAALVWGLPPEAALHRVADPEAAEWSLDSQLLAKIADELAVGNWLASGARRRDRPRPIPRPGVDTPQDEAVYGRGAGLPLDEMDEWLGLTG